MKHPKELDDTFSSLDIIDEIISDYVQEVMAISLRSIWESSPMTQEKKHKY